MVVTKLLTVEEAGEMLRKSPAQMRWLIHAGTGPKSGRLAGRRMFREEDVQAWIDAAFSDDPE